MPSRLVRILPVAFCLPVLCHAAGYGFDAGLSAAARVENLAGAEITGAQGAWLRVRGVAEGDDGVRTVEKERAALRALRERGIQTVVLLRWSPASWKAGARPGGGHRLPLDLREAHARGKRLGETYGDLVDTWEVDNEPDIGFGPDNPEMYAAFLKAVYLGLHDGIAGVRAGSGDTVKAEAATSSWLALKQGRVEFQLHRSFSTGITPRVIMAPLALPPGPYLERLWANGFAGYTDGFNYHYYGFAGDFSGVYRQFRDAVARLGDADEASRRVDRPSEECGGMPRLHKKALPVFITEYGYGLLDAEARNTAEGRARQWRWFADVVGQVRDLRIRAPMAFYWNPYYEADLNEFGLTMTIPARPVAEDGRPGTGDGEQGAQPSTAAPRLVFTPADFGAKRAQPWMNRIGRKVGDWYASPALAYLWDYAGRHPYGPKDWQVRSEPPSPVVIDFIPGSDMRQKKTAGGHELEGNWTPAAWFFSGISPLAASRSGGGILVLYNFSGKPVAGRLDVATDAGAWVSPVVRDITLAPGERRELDVELAVQAASLAASDCRVRFTPSAKGGPRAVWSTRLLPAATGMVETQALDFAFPAEATKACRARLLKRPLADGEAGLRVAGRWLATDGVRVEEHGDLWRFRIDRLPPDPLRPAAAELPLPDGFALPRGSRLAFERRLVPRAEIRANVDKGGRDDAPGLPDPDLKTATAAVFSASRLKSRAGMTGDVMDVYFRAWNGNLFQTWPRLRMTTDWSFYAERAEDFTMAFYGRAELPWRFLDNRPASLVIYFRPSSLPAVFEVRKTRVSTWAMPARLE